MKGLLIKDFLTIKKKYGVPRLIMDVAIIIALMIILEGTGAIYISFLLIPMEVASMVMSLTTCDEQWKWGKYAISLPVSKTQIVKSRYAFALILSLVGFAVALGVNTISFICESSIPIWILCISFHCFPRRYIAVSFLYSSFKLFTGSKRWICGNDYYGNTIDYPWYLVKTD